MQHLVLASLLVPMFLSTDGRNVDVYRVEDLGKLCLSSSGKMEVNLGTRPALFKLQSKDLSRDLSCHLELEIPSGYGLHIYMDEMHLAGNEENDDCIDYVQFGRDILGFTVYRSPQYCGVRPKINHTNPDNAYKAANARGSSNKIRYYVEEKDEEMDLWLKVAAGDRNRNLTLVVTVFKKFCSSSDPKYSQCRMTKYCIRNELFCDQVVNCAWPEGDISTDEQKCDELGDSSSNSVFSPSNIPIIIIVVIVMLGILVVFFVAIRYVYHSLNGPGSANGDGEGDNVEDVTPPLLRHGGDRAVVRPSAPSAPPDEVNSARQRPSAPPSYEDVIKDGTTNNTGDVEFASFPPRPPPYSESEL